MIKSKPEKKTSQALLAIIDELNLRVDELEKSRQDLQNATDQLIEKNDIYRTLLEESSDPIFMFDPGGIYRYANIAFAEGVGKRQDQIIGFHIGDVFPADEAEKRFTLIKWVFKHGQTRVIEVRVPRPDGDRYYITTAKPILDHQGKVVSVICISKEITERKRIESELRRLSTHDALTGLYNRHFFHSEMERLADSLLYPVCVVMTDLDNLKIINDTQGHKAGDVYILRAAELLKSTFRGEDIIARIGGDEFVVLLPQTSQADLVGILARLKTGISLLGDRLFNLSVGWAICEQGCSLEDIMQQADARMYREKILHRQ
jgi:diguanylate cyclase (GGDEF)-like protein/PAS domain S-box-containing protein